MALYRDPVLRAVLPELLHADDNASGRVRSQGGGYAFPPFMVCRDAFGALTVGRSPLLLKCCNPRHLCRRTSVTRRLQLRGGIFVKHYRSQTHQEISNISRIRFAECARRCSSAVSRCTRGARARASSSRSAPCWTASRACWPRCTSPAACIATSSQVCTPLASHQHAPLQAGTPIGRASMDSAIMLTLRSCAAWHATYYHESSDQSHLTTHSLTGSWTGVLRATSSRKAGDD